MLLDVSSTIFSQKHSFDHFDLILFKRHFRKISFSDFVYLLLDRIIRFNINTPKVHFLNAKCYAEFNGAVIIYCLSLQF